jgi:hypothetical protein
LVFLTEYFLDFPIIVIPYYTTLYVDNDSDFSSPEICEKIDYGHQCDPENDLVWDNYYWKIKEIFGEENQESVIFTFEFRKGIPEILALNITDVDNITDNTLDIDTPYKFWLEIKDNNGLSDIDEIELRIFENTLDWNSTDNKRNHYSFKWVRAGADNWFEVGPDNTLPYDHLFVENCAVGSDSENVDNFVFVVKLSKITAPGNWTAWIKVTDNTDASEHTEFQNKFEVNVSLSLSFSQGSVTFKGYPGTADVAAEENPITATIDANVNFDFKEKISGHFTSENKDNIYLDDDGSKPYALTLTTTYQILYDNVGWGEAVEKYEYYFIDIPENVEGTYAITFYTELVAS